MNFFQRTFQWSIIQKKKSAYLTQIDLQQFKKMDRGDNGFVLHESFKDLKTRRAEQEAYRRALEEQIMQKRKQQDKEREIYQGCICVKHFVIMLNSLFTFNIRVFNY